MKESATETTIAIIRNLRQRQCENDGTTKKCRNCTEKISATVKCLHGLENDC